MQLLIISYHIDMYIIIIIVPNNKIIDLIVSFADGSLFNKL